MHALTTTFVFDDSRLSVIEVSGRPVFLVPEVEAALGYPSKGLSHQLAEWSDELLPDIDRIDATGDLLAALKSTGLVGHRASSVGLLTESGVNLVLMKTTKPAGRRLRRLLATEILPQLRKAEHVAPRMSRASAAVALAARGWTPEQVAAALGNRPPAIAAESDVARFLAAWVDTYGGRKVTPAELATLADGPLADLLRPAAKRGRVALGCYLAKMRRRDHGGRRLDLSISRGQRRWFVA